MAKFACDMIPFYRGSLRLARSCQMAAFSEMDKQQQQEQLKAHCERKKERERDIYCALID